MKRIVAVWGVVILFVIVIGAMGWMKLGGGGLVNFETVSQIEGEEMKVANRLKLFE